MFEIIFKHFLPLCWSNLKRACKVRFLMMLAFIQRKKSFVGPIRNERLVFRPAGLTQELEEVDFASCALDILELHCADMVLISTIISDFWEYREDNS